MIDSLRTWNSIHQSPLVGFRRFGVLGAAVVIQRNELQTPGREIFW